MPKVTIDSRGGNATIHSALGVIQYIQRISPNLHTCSRMLHDCILGLKGVSRVFPIRGGGVTYGLPRRSAMHLNDRPTSSKLGQQTGSRRRSMGLLWLVRHERRDGYAPEHRATPCRTKVRNRAASNSFVRLWSLSTQPRSHLARSHAATASDNLWAVGRKRDSQHWPNPFCTRTC